MAKPKRILSPVLFMIGVTALYTLVLASINAVSADRIAAQEALRVESAVLYVNQVASDTDIHDTFTKAFEAHTLKAGAFEGTTYYSYSNEGEPISYTFPFTGKALWGTVKGYIAISADFSKVVGIDFLSHSETPGLGGRIEEEWFKAQFRDIPLIQEPYIRYRNVPDGNVDAITGATLTSNAVRDMLNTTLIELENQKEAVMAHE